MLFDDNSAGSGVRLADHRLEIADMLAEAGDHAAAAEVASQALELAPDWTAGWFRLGEHEAAAGRLDPAAAAFRRCLALGEDDRFGASARLALLGRMPGPEGLPSSYVKGLFDGYSDSFESSLVVGLGYRGPELLWQLAQSLRGDTPQMMESALDLGCGTGLMGTLLRPLVHRLDGVDLSPGMLRVAGAKRLYDRLIEAEATAYLVDCGQRYDLIAAADVVPYMGRLEALLRAAFACLADGGHLVLTAEASDLPGFHLGRGTRYAHHADCITEAAAAAGLDVLRIERATCRMEAGVPVASLLVALGRPKP